MQEEQRAGCEPNPCPRLCLDYGDHVACQCDAGFTGRGLQLRTLTRRDVVSVSRQSRELRTSRLGLGLFHVVGRDVLCGVRTVWRSIVVVVPYRPICLSP